MKLTARNKKHPTSESLGVQREKPVRASGETNYTHSITIQCNTLLYDTLRNMIMAAHTANDFTYHSIADIIRAALQAHKDGMELIELDKSGARKQTTIRVTEEQYDFYRALPDRMRRKILERAIRTYLKQL